MKNRGVNLLLAITCLFIGITIGFSIGRNANHQTVTLSVPAVSVDNTSISETVSRSSLVSIPLTTSADADTVPSEQTTPTETQFTIPEVTQPPETTQSAPVFPINVNTADHQTLMELPGICSGCPALGRCWPSGLLTTAGITVTFLPWKN